MTLDYDKILKSYPKYMSLEQMRVACHISKKTARLLLQTGLVPCKKNGKKTHTYQIKKSAVFEYLVQRDITPEKYGFRNGSYDLAYEKAISGNDTDADSSDDNSDMGHDAFPVYKEFPDVLTTQQAAKLSGVAQTTINDWVKKSHIRAFRKSGVCLIPKISLVEYLRSPQHEFNRSWQQEQFAKRT